MLQVTLLGTAALYPLPQRALTAVYLACGGRAVLFDCGEGTQTAVVRAGLSLMKLDLIALTHYHGDHCLGLPGLMQTLGSMDRSRPLYVTGPEGLETAFAPIAALAGRLPYEVRLLPSPGGGLRLETLDGAWGQGAVLSCFQTEHRVPSRGYVFRLERKGRFLPEKAEALGIPRELWGRLQRGEEVRLGSRLFSPGQVLGEPRRGLKAVFSGDTGECAALTEAAKDADLLICEATYGENDQADLAAERGHMTFAQAARTAAEAGARRLWLAHYSPRIEDPAAFLPNALEWFSKTVCGQDGMGTVLRFDGE